MSEKHRYIALKLCNLRRADRQWVLKQLPEPDRMRIDGYLSELNAFRLDKETIQAALHSRFAQKKGVAQSESVLPSVEARRRVLAGEPAWVVRALAHKAGGAVRNEPAAGGEVRLAPAAQVALEMALLRRADQLAALPGVVTTRHARAEVASEGGLSLKKIVRSWLR
ncbi:MAG: hypothetical protein QM776_13465 [Rhodocyclaceae bacterium]